VGASASATVSWDVLAQKGKDSAEDAREGEGSAQAALRRTWAMEKELDLCPPDDPHGGLLIPGDKLFEVELPVPGKPRSCVTRARAGADGTAEAAVDVGSDVMRIVAAGRSGAQITATNGSALDTVWTGGGRFVSRWNWLTTGTGAGTTALKALVRIEGGPGAAATVEIPDLARLSLWEGRVEGQIRKGGTWEDVNLPPPVELYAEAVIVGGKGAICAQGDVSAVSKGDRGTARVTSAARVEVRVDAVDRSDFPAVPKNGPEFSGCGCD
jgi:hypothetical protein